MPYGRFLTTKVVMDPKGLMTLRYSNCPCHGMQLFSYYISHCLHCICVCKQRTTSVFMDTCALVGHIPVRRSWEARPAASSINRGCTASGVGLEPWCLWVLEWKHLNSPPNFWRAWIKTRYSHEIWCVCVKTQNSHEIAAIHKINFCKINRKPYTHIPSVTTSGV